MGLGGIGENGWGRHGHPCTRGVHPQRSQTSRSAYSGVVR